MTETTCTNCGGPKPDDRFRACPDCRAYWRAARCKPGGPAETIERLRAEVAQLRATLAELRGHGKDTDRSKDTYMTQEPEDDGFVTCFPVPSGATDLCGVGGCLGAAISAQQAARDLVFALAHGVHPADNVGTGETLASLAQVIWLTHGAMPDTDERDDRLAAAAERYLEDRS